MTTRHSAFAIRPGSKFKAWDTKWKVLDNDTLNQTMTLVALGGPRQRKRIRYNSGTTISCYWVPFDTR